jgi:hypothetical protein
MLQTGNFIAQSESPLFEPPHDQLVGRGYLVSTVNQRVEITVLNTQFDQAPLRGVMIRFQKSDRQKYVVK